MLLEETLNNPHPGFEAAAFPREAAFSYEAMSPQLALVPFWSDYSPDGQDETLLFHAFADGDEDDDVDEDDNFDDMEDDFDDDFDDDDDYDDDEDDDYEDEDEDFDYEEDVDYDEFDE